MGPIWMTNIPGFTTQPHTWTPPPVTVRAIWGLVAWMAVIRDDTSGSRPAEALMARGLPWGYTVRQARGVGFLYGTRQAVRSLDPAQQGLDGSKSMET